VAESSLGIVTRSGHNSGYEGASELNIQNDASIRAALLPRLRDLLALESPCLLIEELGIDHGRSRIDVAVLGSCVYGFEIKAACDSLSRLPQQVAQYDRLVDFPYLVLTANHLNSATASTPSHWGIILAVHDESQIDFRIVRNPTRNERRQPESLARLLWRGEALAVLVSLGLDRGFRGKSARILHQRLASALELEALGEIVLHQIRQRSEWGDRQKRPVYLTTSSCK